MLSYCKKKVNLTYSTRYISDVVSILVCTPLLTLIIIKQYCIVTQLIYCFTTACDPAHAHYVFVLRVMRGGWGVRGI